MYSLDDLIYCFDKNESHSDSNSLWFWFNKHRGYCECVRSLVTNIIASFIVSVLVISILFKIQSIFRSHSATNLSFHRVPNSDLINSCACKSGCKLCKSSKSNMGENENNVEPEKNTETKSNSNDTHSLITKECETESTTNMWEIEDHDYTSVINTIKATLATQSRIDDDMFSNEPTKDGSFLYEDNMDLNISSEAQLPDDAKFKIKMLENELKNIQRINMEYDEVDEIGVELPINRPIPRRFSDGKVKDIVSKFETNKPK
jgi:hypothetical protein